jgi:hypothetical protein
VYNTVPSSIVLTSNAGAGGPYGPGGPGATGSVWTLSPGTYIIDYETSLGATGSSLAIYVGSTGTALTLDPNTVAGSSTPSTWIHGRAIQMIPTTIPTGPINGGTIVGISPAGPNPASIQSAGDNGSPMIRVTFMKTA